MVRRTGFVLTMVLAAATMGAIRPQAPQSGDAVYQRRCASCHDAPDTRAPRREALNQMYASRIRRVLDFGSMMIMAREMDGAERDAVATYLGLPGNEPAPAPRAFCADRSVTLPAGSVPAWNGWSATLTNTRFQAAQAAGLTRDQVRGLKLKWAYAFPGDVNAIAAPSVFGPYVFVGSAGGRVQALDAASGCIHWTFDADGPVRAAIVVAPLGPLRQGVQQHTLLVGDLAGWFYSLDASTGQLLWKRKVDAHEAARVTAAPVVRGDTVIIPIASSEENRATNRDYACCTFRGSVLALRISDGAPVWRTYMIPDMARPLTQQPGVIGQWGPAGAGIWSTPTIDTRRGLLYVTTGNNYASPATSMSNAVVALESATGRIVWSRQLTPRDVYNGACAAGDTCPGPDFDFAASAILETLPDGRDLLLAGQKSGLVYALDPSRRGEVVWTTRVSTGGVNGGVQWGMASDGRHVYAAASDLGRMRRADIIPNDPRPNTVDPQQGGGLTALRIARGDQAWRAAPAGCGDRPECSPAQPAAVTAIPGVVFSGSLDGHLRAFSADDGSVLWDFDTVRSYETANGVPGKGGALDGPGAVVVNGMVFVNSGYARNGGMAGNVLLAFAPEP